MIVQMPENMIARLRVQPHDEREDERGAEHRHHVLGADADRLAPREPLARCHRLARGGIDHVPLEHRHDVTSFARDAHPSAAPLPDAPHETPAAGAMV